MASFVIDGIPTEELAELVGAGDSVEMVATNFDLHLEEVIAALGYESTPSPAA